MQRSIEYLRSEIPAVRRRRGGPVLEEPAKDLVAAAYRHTTARGVSGAQAPDPQLHSHVVITAAIRDDDRLVAVASRPIFRRKRELGAFYRSALAQELQQIGLAIRSRTGHDGRYFEVAGVPATVIEAFSQRSREVARESERFRTRYGRAPLPGELRHLKLENRKAKQLTTRGDLDRAWSETATRLAFGPDEALQLIVVDRPKRARGSLADRIEPLLTEERAVFTASTLRAVALEQSAGELAPQQALVSVERMIRNQRVIPLEGGRFTTRSQRERELAIERHITTLARDPHPVVVRDRDRTLAERVVAERIAAPLTREQRDALETITGPERIAVLIGPAGTGKGVVIDAAARAEQHAGRETIGVAVSGSTAERLGHDSPAPASAPNGSSPATNSATKDKTPTASPASPNTCETAAPTPPPSTTPSDTTTTASTQPVARRNSTGPGSTDSPAYSPRPTSPIAAPTTTTHTTAAADL